MRGKKPAGPSRPGGRRKLVPGEQWLVRREGSAVWHYDFQIERERFRGSCGTDRFEAAAAYAHARHDEEWRRIKLGEAPAKHLTLNDAFVRFYREVAKGTSYGERSQKYQMARMLRLLGKELLLADLTQERVNDLVQLLRTTPLATEQDRKPTTRRKIPVPLKRESKVASAATINRYLDTLWWVCRRAREVWGVEVGPWSRSKFRKDKTLREPPPPQNYATPEQARALLREATPHVVPLFALDLMTGLRKGNVVSLQWESVSLPFGRILLIGKGNKEISVPLTPEAKRLLERLEPDPDKRQGPVFYYGNPNVPCPCPACSRPKMKLIGRQFVDPKRAIRTALRRAGLEGFRFHDMRHTFASWLLDEGGNLKLVQEALHHSNIQTTMRYAHLLVGRRAAVTERATAGLLDPPAPEPKRDDDEEQVA